MNDVLKKRVDTLREEDVFFVAEHMRGSDVREVRAAFNVDPLTAAKMSVSLSTLKWTIRRGETAVGIFGVGAGSMLSKKGSPWLLATPALEEVSLRFLRQSRKYVGMMLERHSFLENWVDARNLISIKWLEWCGFTFEEPVPFGYEKKLFHRFYMKRG